MTRSYRYVLLLLCLVVVPAQAGITGTITGVVRDVNQEPLYLATVTVIGTVLGAKSDRKGEFTIPNVVAGEIKVRVTSIGYDTVVYNIKLSADAVRTVSITLKESKGVLTGLIFVEDTVMIDAYDGGQPYELNEKDLTSGPKTTIAASISTLPSMTVSNQGISGRLSRPSETQMNVDGQQITDLILGSFGNAGPTVSSSMPSPFALKSVQANAGGYGVEYGGATSSTINAIVKTGSTEKFTGLMNWRKDVPLLFGKANNGVQAGSPLEDVFDFTLDGPLGINKSTFSFAVRNTYQNHRNFGLQVFDPIGNNLGEMPNNRTWLRNMLGRVKFEVMKNMSLLVGGMYGVLNGERNSWDWMYATDEGVLVDPFGSPILANGLEQRSGVLERTAKQVVVQEFSANLFAQLQHTLNASTVYDLRFSYNAKTTETGKRRSFDAPNVFTGFDLWYPEDSQTIADSMMSSQTVVPIYVNGSNRILDVYDYSRTSVFTDDGYARLEVNRRNPLTGYVEGPVDRASTNNPYGLIDYFAARGNEGGVDFRNSRYFQIDGNLTHVFESDTNTRHNLRAGFELRLMRLARHYNATPWQQDPFYDVFGSDYGGNLYFDVTSPASVAAKTASEQPYTPITASVYVQDQIIFQSLVFTPGIRADFLDAGSLYRTQLDPFMPFGSATGFSEVKPKLYLSPRISVTYPINHNGSQNISLAYGIYYQAPPFADFFDSFNSDKLIAGQTLGNPNLEMQRSNQYQVSYNHQLSADLAFTITGYYRDIYNQSSLAYVNVLPVPYYQHVLADYGSARGIELTFIKRLRDNWGVNLNYTLAAAKGTSNDAGSVPAIDPVTGKPAYPTSDFPLSYDRRHRINGTLSLEWEGDEGPRIAGIPFLEHMAFNLSGFWQSGLPYTLSNSNGQAISGINSARYPSNWSTDLRIQRTIPLDSLIGGSTSLDIYFDVTNLFNATDAISFYSRTGSPDYDGAALNRVPGDFPSTTYFKSADPTNKSTAAPAQYDRVGKRLYNERVDSNADGKVTPEESYQGYQAYVQTVIARQSNYQYPRQVYFGMTFRF